MYYLKFILFTVILLLPISVNAQLPIKDNIASYIKSGSRATVNALYEANNYNPLWIGSENSKQFSQLLRALGNPLFNYKYKQLNQDKIIDLALQDENNAKLDILATEAYLKLIHFIRAGDVDWALVKRKLHGLKTSQDVHATWEISPKSMPSSDSILSSIQNKNIKGYLSSLLPLVGQYKPLVIMLERYRNMPSLGKIQYGKILKKGRQDSRIRTIKKLLQFTGDFPKNESTGTGYTKSLSRAIISFKNRFNLAKGDYIDNKVINYLNTSKQEYIKKITTNLDMLKLQPHRFEANHVQINVPEFKLRYYQGGAEAFSSDIVVGRIDRPTPIFNDKIEYLVLNPTWTLTDNLVKKDLIPMLKENPNYLKENNMRVFTSYKKDAKESPLNLQKLFSYEHSKKPVPYRFVQYPGENNALGRVKFMFPNKYAVYLHDTDNKSLFKHRYRVFSSGCMRVKKPFDFMYELFGNAGNSYSKSKIQSIFATNEPTTIRLKRAVPVYTLYQTVRRSEGKDLFFYDVYMYEQIVRESTAGNKKATFRVPEKRLTKIKRVQGASVR
ncbi:MAG: L,D-transpeptidase family protein [Sulfurovum sp.]|nr:L,D-transpeptidase family protein [Sulfurovum sp.]